MNHWLTSYALAVEWHARRLRPWLLSILGFQLVTGVGTAIGLGFLFPHITPTIALYLSTGAPTAMLLGLGLVILPALVSRAKEDGTFEFMMTLPIPRLAYLAADLTVWSGLILPGVVTSVLVASNRYDFHLEVSPLVVPVVLLIALTAASIGYAYALVSPSHVVTSVVANFIILSIFLLSPVNFPVDRLPSSLEAAHRFLPIEAAADLMRATLTPAASIHGSRSVVVLLVWTAWSLALVQSLMTKRR